MTGESIADRPTLNVPYLAQVLAKIDELDRKETYANKLVLGSCGKVLPIGAEAHTTDIQVTRHIDILVLQDTNFLSGCYIIDLRRAVAACRNVLAVSAESDTAHNTFVYECVNQVNI